MYLSWCLALLVAHQVLAVIDFKQDTVDNYLSDQAVGHYHGNWSFDERCLNDTRLLFRDMQNLTLWATTMWDASAQQPSGLLYGATFQLGNFDECLDPGLTLPYGMQAQYCLADVLVLQPPRNVSTYDRHRNSYESALDKIYYTGDQSRRRRDVLHWAVCVPASCSPGDVQALMEGYFNYTSSRVEHAQPALSFQVSLDEYSCQEQKPVPYPIDTLAFFLLVALLIFLSVTCSMAHWHITRNDDNRVAETKVPPLVLAFSMLEHGRQLGKTSASEGSRALFGLRYICIIMVVLDHRVGITASGPLDNWQFIENRYLEWSSILITHGDLLVDTFFVLAGILVVRPLLDSKNYVPLLAIIYRYVRVVPGYAMMMFYTASAAPHLGQGPLWSRVVGEESRACVATWWWGLLMLGNYVHDDHICMTSSWYIPCDFHMFACAVLLCGVIRARPRSGLALLCAALLAGVLVPGLVTAYYRLPALLHFYDEFLLHPRTLPIMRLVYTKSHTRAAAYIIGLLAGYLASRYHKPGTRPLSRTMSTVGAVLSLGILLAAVSSGATFYQPGRPYNLLEASLYSALIRPMWAVGISLLMLCLIYGQIPLISSFLAWRAWVPLGKLSYSVYLVHMQMQIADVASLRQPQHLSVYYGLHRWLGDIVMTTILGLVLYLLVEAPCKALFVLALMRKSRISTTAPSDEKKEPPALPSYKQEDPERLQFPPPQAYTNHFFLKNVNLKDSNKDIKDIS